MRRGRLSVAFTSSSQNRGTLADINVTPLVDVVLVLLVIFMITAPVLQSGIEVAVPKTRTVKEITEQRLVVTIDKDQKVFWVTRQSMFTSWRRSCMIPEAILRTR